MLIFLTKFKSKVCSYIVTRFKSKVWSYFWPNLSRNFGEIFHQKLLKTSFLFFPCYSITFFSGVLRSIWVFSTKRHKTAYHTWKKYINTAGGIIIIYENSRQITKIVFGVIFFTKLRSLVKYFIKRYFIKFRSLVTIYHQI